jgi:hypothetical protein
MKTFMGLLGWHPSSPKRSPGAGAKQWGVGVRGGLT